MPLATLLTPLLFGITQVLASAHSNGNLAICKPWRCINEHSGLTLQNDQFDPEKLRQYMALVLPDEKWTYAVDHALKACSDTQKPRPYSTTCPGQEIWHCLVDQLMQNCPESNSKKDKACSNVASLIGAKYLFYQNTYTDIDNAANDQLNQAFLRNVFKSKCCELPPILPKSTLDACNVSTFLHVQDRPNIFTRTPALSAVKTDAYCSQPIDDINPLECCDTSDFIAPSTFETCDVALQWNSHTRLVLNDKTPSPTATEKPKHDRRLVDVKVVPESCEGLTCAFKKLNLVSSSGTIDKTAYARLLEQLAREHPTWAPAGARAITRCLQRDLREEYDGCELTRLVACTMDVLAENCPNTKKGFSDPCRHPGKSHNSTAVCQVSSSNFKRVRHRYCDVPRLVPPNVLHECGLTSLVRMLAVKDSRVAVAQNKHAFHPFNRQPMCMKTSNSTNCVLEKLGLLNKYQFMDGLKMKRLVDEALRKHPEWSVNRIPIEDSMRFMPMYKDYSVSTRKLLNLLDAAVTNCPFHKRAFTSKCTRFYGYLNRCTPKTASRPSTQPPVSVIRPPLNVTFHNRTVQVSGIRYPIAHVASKQPSYARSYEHYMPSSDKIPFSNSRLLPTSHNSNLAVSSRVYSPIYAQSYAYPVRYSSNAQNIPQPLLPYFPSKSPNGTPVLVKNVYRAPTFHAVKASQDQKFGEHDSTMLNHWPVEGQVYV